MKYEIEVCTKEGDSNTDKGRLLEKLASEILEVQQYKVVETVRVTSMEIDVLARHKISNSVIFVECKAWDNPLSADVITKLLGNVVIRNANEGWLITRSRYGATTTGLFWGQTSPDKVIEVWKLIKNGEDNYTTLKGKGYRNAIEVLTTTIGIERRDDRLVVLKDLDEVFEIINASDTICYVKHLIDENNNIKSLEVGEKLNDKFHRKWQRSSKMRYGNALLSWSKFLRQKFNN